MVIGDVVEMGQVMKGMKGGADFVEFRVGAATPVQPCTRQGWFRGAEVR